MYSRRVKRPLKGERDFKGEKMAVPVAFVGFGLLVGLVELGFLVVLLILIILGFLVVLVFLDFYFF